MEPKLIDSAPKDGSEILIFEKGWSVAKWKGEVGYGVQNGWQAVANKWECHHSDIGIEIKNPTHWIELPNM